MGNKILNEIREYSPHCEKWTLSTLMAIQQKMNIINLSKAGYSKTRCTKELLDLLKIDYKLISGHISEKGLYLALCEDKLTIIDESASMLSDRTIINMLLSALWSKHIQWITNDGIQEHQFDGNIIFNSNYLPNTPFIEALKDRVIFNEIKLNSSQIEEKIKSNYKPNKKIWREILEKLKSEQNEPDSEEVYPYVKNPKSVRALWKLKKIVKLSIALVGDYSLIKFFVDDDEVWNIINSDLKNKDKVKKISEIKKIGIRQAQKIIKNGL